MSITAILKQADIFYELTQSQLELIASVCNEKEYQPGDVVFAEQSESNELYVVADGEVEIRVDPSLVRNPDKKTEETKVIAVIRRGQSFGEMALLDEGRRSASAICAQGDARLIIVPRDKLISLCETYPHLGYRLMFNLCLDLSMKIRNADLQIREQVIWAQNNKKPID